MNLYKIFQEVNNGYDTFDSAVVVAISEDDARSIHPSEYSDTVLSREEWEKTPCGVWAPLEDVQVTYLGVASEALNRGIVVASFNAG